MRAVPATLHGRWEDEGSMEEDRGMKMSRLKSPKNRTAKEPSSEFQETAS
jgi:hypothetical protein